MPWRWSPSRCKWWSAVGDTVVLPFAVTAPTFG